MVPVFIGITLVTFGVASLAGDPVEAAATGEETALRAPMSRDDARRLRERLGLHLPAIVNLEVRDRRIHVEQLARRAAAWPEVLELVRMRTRKAAGKTGAPPAAAARSLGTRLARRMEALPGIPPRLKVLAGAVLPPETAGALAPRLGALQSRVDAVWRACRRLTRLGGMAVVHLPPVLGEVRGGAARRLLAACAERAAGRALGSEEELRGVARRLRASCRSPRLERLVTRWRRAAEAQVEARRRLRETGADTARSELAVANALLEGISSELAPLGGLAAPAVMEAALGSGPHVRRLAVAWMREHAGWDAQYAPVAPPGARLTPALEEQQARLDTDLEERWCDVRLRYREIGWAERWLLRSWTRTRYAHWLGAVVSLDFGESLLHRRPVAELIMERLPTTLMLQVPAVLLMYLLAVPLGVWSAVRRGRWSDHLIGMILLALYALPAFWVATVCVLYVGPHPLVDLPVYGLHDPAVEAQVRAGRLSPWSPAYVLDLLRHLVMPVVVLAYGGMAVLARYGRAGMVDVLDRAFVRTARAQGLPERRVVWRFALRNGIIPLVTLFGALLPAMVGGSVVVEGIFGIPGMGLLTLEAARRADVPVAMGVVSLVAVLTMLGYLLTDVLYGLLDPRVREAA